jgi:ribosomal protein S18 acetylase RimI-like enzyme
MEGTSALAARVQDYLAASAGQRYTAVEAWPYTVFINPLSDFPHFNYAIPRPARADEYRRGLGALQDRFQTHERQPRLEFVEACAPGLPAVLEGAGFACEARQSLMVCTPERFCGASLPAGVTVARVPVTAPEATLAAYWRVQAEGFGGTAPQTVPPGEVAGLRATLAKCRAYWALLDGQPASVAMVTAPMGQVAELVAVTTWPALRRRGIGRAVSGTAVQSAFDGGVEVVCLTAEDAAAEQLYTGLGFTRIGAMLAYGVSSA